MSRGECKSPDEVRSETLFVIPMSSLGFSMSEEGCPPPSPSFSVSGEGCPPSRGLSESGEGWPPPSPVFSVSGEDRPSPSPGFLRQGRVVLLLFMSGLSSRESLSTSGVFLSRTEDRNLLFYFRL